MLLEKAQNEKLRCVNEAKYDSTLKELDHKSCFHIVKMLLGLRLFPYKNHPFFCCVKFVNKFCFLRRLVQPCAFTVVPHPLCFEIRAILLRMLFMSKNCRLKDHF